MTPQAHDDARNPSGPPRRHPRHATQQRRAPLAAAALLAVAVLAVSGFAAAAPAAPVTAADSGGSDSPSDSPSPVDSSPPTDTTPPDITSPSLDTASPTDSATGSPTVDPVPSSPTDPATTSTSSAPAAPAHPNIVYVMTDDLSNDLVQYMPHVVQLAQDGTSFTNYTVTDSLCCPSRASFLAGEFPHNTGVLGNVGPNGGFSVFNSRGEESSTVATDLQNSGYRTAMMGKYLNGYGPTTRSTTTKQTYVPPGWNEWDVAGWGYGEFNYVLNHNHKVEKFGATPDAYLTDVLSQRADSFVSSAAHDGQPFYLEVATFAPHKPYTPAPRDANSFAGVAAPRTPRYNTVPTSAPAWLAKRPKLGIPTQTSIDADYRKRVQSVQAVDALIASLEQTISDAGVTNDTDIVFSSDNGFHMGDYRLLPGKMTAFDTDINVPLVMTGPGIPAGATNSDPVENIDLRPTFDGLAGTTAPGTIDGHSFVPLVYGNDVAGWRTSALIEHRNPGNDPGDPDYTPPAAGVPPSYAALRTTSYTYVEYVTGEREYYDRTTDPWELHNVVSSLSPDRLQALHDQLVALSACQGQSACWDSAGGRS